MDEASEMVTTEVSPLDNIHSKNLGGNLEKTLESMHENHSVPHYKHHYLRNLHTHSHGDTDTEEWSIRSDEEHPSYHDVNEAEAYL